MKERKVAVMRHVQETVRLPENNRESSKRVSSVFTRIYCAVADHLTVSLNHDNEQFAAEDEIVAAIHENAEVFDEKTELALRPCKF